MLLLVGILVAALAVAVLGAAYLYLLRRSYRGEELTTRRLASDQVEHPLRRSQ